MAERETTSIRIDPKLWQDLKVHCVTKKLIISDVLENLIKRELKRKA